MVATFDQCQFGLTSPVNKIPMQKRTKILTNCKKIHAALDGVLCDHSHQHQPIQGAEGGVKRSQFAQCYPDPLVHTLCKAMLG